MVRRASFLAVSALAGLMAACSGASHTSVVPPSAERGGQQAKAVPITSPTPTPSGLVGNLTSTLGSVLCGVAGGVTCGVVAGAGPQGLPAGTDAASLPGLHPADLQSAYGLGQAVGHATVGIVVAYDNPKLESDLGVYRAKYGLPACTTANGCFKKIVAGGLIGSLIGGDQGWGQESSLDVDMVSAACPSCRILVVEATSASLSALRSAAATAVANGATVLSASFVAPEYSGEMNDDASWSFGVPLIAGAGDSGYGAGWPAASSHAIAVGGTSLARSGNARGWTESVWAGSGGGCSAYAPKPSWQHDGGCAHRTLNDISAMADPNPGVSVYDSYLSNQPGWRTYGGTSVATPLVASAIAASGASHAFLNAAAVYAIAPYLNDVLSGSNGNCDSYLCSAGAGYDGPSGNGSPPGLNAFRSQMQ